MDISVYPTMPKQSDGIYLYDNIISHTSGRGVSRYFFKIAEGIIEHFGERVIVYSSASRDYGIARHMRPWAPRGGRRFRLDDIQASISAYRCGASVFYSSYYGSAWSRAPRIFSVYDMIHEKFPHYFPERHAPKFVVEKRRCLEQATTLLSISEQTATDIVTIYPHIDPAKITVTYPGVDNIFFQGGANLPPLDVRPFFLFVGHRKRYKNFFRLLTAFAESGLAKDFDLRVISPIDTTFDRQEVNCIKKYNIQEKVHLILAPSDSTLIQHYSQAVALVYPSEYEGFGLPVLEALASGTIVAISSTSSLLEVGGTIAFYFDPYDINSIADCLLSVVNLPVDLRNKHIGLGKAHAQTFTWQRCQEQTVRVFKELLR